MAYLYNVSIFIDDDSDNLEYQNVIDDLLDKGIARYSKLEYVSARIIELDHCSNSGKCSNCGARVSDHDEENCITEFSDGCIIEGKWYCDLCLPEEHPKHF
jgi:hypothetical protein